jgi:acetate kinase
VALDERANGIGDEGEIGVPGNPTRVALVHAEEEIVIARAVFRVAPSLSRDTREARLG